MAKITNREKGSTPNYGAVRSVAAMGKLFRAERRRQGLTQAQLYAVTGLSTRFLSEFERGKPNVSLVRVFAALNALGLEMLVVPRGNTAARPGGSSPAAMPQVPR